MRKIIAVLATAALFTGAFFATTFRATAAPQKTSVIKELSYISSGGARSFPKVMLRLVSAAQTYTVRKGDSLSAIAASQYGSAKDWPVLYWANRSSVKWADLIGIGWVLTVPPLPAVLPALPSGLAPASALPATVTTDRTQSRGGAYGHPNFCGDGDGDGWDVSCPSAMSASRTDAAPASKSYKKSFSVSSSYSGTTSFQRCVISRESGGNSQVTNSSGHYGLYQFSYSTWVAYGGSASAFGHASVSQQNQVFASAMATPGGASNWSPYDGCAS